MQKFYRLTISENFIDALILTKYLKIDEQQKAQKQIDITCADGRHPTFKDRSSLTQVEAIILETLRLVNICKKLFVLKM